MVSAYGIRALGLAVVTRVYHTRKRLICEGFVKTDIVVAHGAAVPYITV